MDIINIRENIKKQANTLYNCQEGHIKCSKQQKTPQHQKTTTYDNYLATLHQNSKLP